jgi:hypothetical protein
MKINKNIRNSLSLGFREHLSHETVLMNSKRVKLRNITEERHNYQRPKSESQTVVEVAVASGCRAGSPAYVAWRVGTTTDTRASLLGIQLLKNFVRNVNKLIESPYLPVRGRK